MKKIIRNSMYSLVWGLSLLQVAATQASDFWKEKVQSWMVGTESSADQAIQMLITTAMWFLYLIAIVYGLWWGFNILTAAWDEDKVKKWKTIIIHTIIWLIVIWLVGSIVDWVVTQLLWAS